MKNVHQRVLFRVGTRLPIQTMESCQNPYRECAPSRGKNPRRNRLVWLLEDQKLCIARYFDGIKRAFFKQPSNTQSVFRSRKLQIQSRQCLYPYVCPQAICFISGTSIGRNYLGAFLRLVLRVRCLPSSCFWMFRHATFPVLDIVENGEDKPIYWLFHCECSIWMPLHWTLPIVLGL